MTQSPSPSFGKVWSSITGGLRVVSQTVLLWIAGLTTFWKGGVVMKSETLETRNTGIKLKIKLLRKGEEWGLLMITDLLVHFQHWKRYNIWATVPQLGVHLKAWCFCYTTSVWKFSSIQKRPLLQSLSSEKKLSEISLKMWFINTKRGQCHCVSYTKWNPLSWRRQQYCS